MYYILAQKDKYLSKTILQIYKIYFYFNKRKSRTFAFSLRIYCNTCMAKHLKIKKGLDIPISGASTRRLVNATDIKEYAIKPTDYVGLTPKLMVAEGDTVEAGSAVICDKNNQQIQFTSPVTGVVKAIRRGQRRVIQEIVIERTGSESQHAQFNTNNIDIKQLLLTTGLWTALRQRPFGIIAQTDQAPKSIYVSCFDSSPLAPDADFVMQGRENDFVKGVETLTKLTQGNVNLTFRPNQELYKTAVEKLGSNNKVGLYLMDGPHPAGNVGTQIAAIDPINKGEIVWTIQLQDVATIGHLMLTGEYLPTRIIAVGGPEASTPQYYQVLAGASMQGICAEQLSNDAHCRIISGNPLTGTQIQADGFLGAYDNMCCMLGEGDYYDFMGWLLPGFKKYSFWRTFLSGFCKKKACATPSKGCTYTIDTNMHGENRPFIFSEQYEDVFPFDIHPVHLIKAAIIGDIELMENLGIYEVEPEDFALCEFIDPSKTEIQYIIREALEKIRRES